MTNPVPRDDAFAAFIEAWTATCGMPRTEMVKRRKAIAEGLGITLNAAKVRFSDYLAERRKLGCPVSVPSPAPSVARAARPARAKRVSRALLGVEGVGEGDGDPILSLSPSPTAERLSPSEAKSVLCLPLNALERGGCAFLIGEAPEARYCNAPVVQGKPYCAGHCAICYVQRKEAA